MRFNELTQQIEKEMLLDFGSIFGRSFDLFKKVWLEGFIVLLLTFVTIVPFYILIYIPMIIAGVSDPEMLRSDEVPPELVIPMLVLMPVVLIGIMTIGLLLNASFLRICKNKDLGKIGSESYFFFFKKPYLSKAVLLSLILLGLTVLGMLTCGIGIFYLIVPMSLFPAFLAFDEELTAMEIVKSSFKLGNKNWLVIFGLIILMGFIAELGILLCFVGILFTAMLSKVPLYYIYKDAVGFGQDEE